MFYHSVRFLYERTTLRFSKGGAKVDTKKTSLEFRDSFGTGGTISVLSVLNRYKNGTNYAYYYNAS